VKEKGDDTCAADLPVRKTKKEKTQRSRNAYCFIHSNVINKPPPGPQLIQQILQFMHPYRQLGKKMIAGQSEQSSSLYIEPFISW
jgi:hypothetical protein